MSKCGHWAVGYIKSKSRITPFVVVPDLCRCYARVYRDWVGVGETSVEELLKILKCFTKFKYCPKCGEKLNFEETKRELQNE